MWTLAGATDHTRLLVTEPGANNPLEFRRTTHQAGPSEVPVVTRLPVEGVTLSP